MFNLLASCNRVQTRVLQYSGTVGLNYIVFSPLSRVYMYVHAPWGPAFKKVDGIQARAEAQPLICCLVLSASGNI
jgi:hypothetical protein